MARNINLEVTKKPPMSTIKLIILLLFTGPYLFGQIGKITVKATDTIDYMYLSSAKGYELKKVMDLSTTISHQCQKDFRFSGRADSLDIQQAKKNGKTLLASDSIIDISWFLINKTECFPGNCAHRHAFWKFSINRKSNVFILDKVFCLQAQDLKHILLKVIKLSQFEIILEDMNDKVWHRRYYFLKK